MLCQQAGYVALSRGRKAHHVYTGYAAVEPWKRR
jgi:hypothetical protein